MVTVFNDGSVFNLYHRLFVNILRDIEGLKIKRLQKYKLPWIENPTKYLNEYKEGEEIKLQSGKLSQFIDWSINGFQGKEPHNKMDMKFINDLLQQSIIKYFEDCFKTGDSYKKLKYYYINIFKEYYQRMEQLGLDTTYLSVYEDLFKNSLIRVRERVKKRQQKGKTKTNKPIQSEKEVI